ncbi:DNA mismatch repair protein MutH [Psychrobacillus sp. BL-248-WT-3]|uniref:DNA mismatch repair protein MutH n=1 Tax=Psychrobacillus sp. BL-248-WT-3 TaxID=2725306 RepID=UPI00146A6A5A|nr:DNA mismatch repair protein MutH [Psychrobacillus sp. BL-248-WT-3]NME06219.1 DNA mismatch repair protein MutH [Psychrobacillus sp. BL-248-WT-3]
MNESEELIIFSQIEIDDKISKYKGMKVSDLKESLAMPLKDNKASFVQLARKMMDITNSQFSLCDNRVDAVLKTVRLTGMETPAEAMSFMPVNFKEWSEALCWESSSLYRYFNKKILVLFIFQQYPNGQRVDDSEMTFLDAKVWKMSEYDLNHGLKEVWERVRYLINAEKLEITPVKQKNGKIINKNNLPSGQFNSLGHLRPGAINGDDKILLPNGQRIVKQRFWFNTQYVKEIIDL